MKQHNNPNDEALYQQIMAELKPGADEYDTLMRKGQNPASRHKPYLIYKYVAAACIAFAIVCTSLMLLMNNGTETQIVQVTAYKAEAEETDNHLIAQEEAEPDVPLATESTHTKAGNAKANATSTPNRMKSETSHHEAETDESEQEFLYALITEVEHRALAEQEEDERLRRQIIEEISANIINESNNPELTL